MKRKYWIVIPDDPDMEPKSFKSVYAAEDYAAGLCCSYDIQLVRY